MPYPRSNFCSASRRLQNERQVLAHLALAVTGHQIVADDPIQHAARLRRKIGGWWQGFFARRLTTLGCASHGHRQPLANASPRPVGSSRCSIPGRDAPSRADGW